MTFDFSLSLFQAIQIVFFVISTIGVVVALLTYRKNSKLKKAEWLETLFEKFYEGESYKETRKRIDYETLEAKLKKDKNSEEDLVNYLNFFEFIAILWVLKQITLKELLMLFEYYLKLISKSKFLKAYIAENGFENLQKLIQKIERK